MFYSSNTELPSSVRELPTEAQDIYRRTFNDAYGNRARDPVEKADAHNAAWEAVERAYVKQGGEWVLRGVPG
jgi:cation transport regulator